MYAGDNDMIDWEELVNAFSLLKDEMKPRVQPCRANVTAIAVHKCPSKNY